MRMIDNFDETEILETIKIENVRRSVQYVLKPNEVNKAVSEEGIYFAIKILEFSERFKDETLLHGF